MQESGHKLRILVAKPGLDSHWTGALLVAKALSEAGMEVIYTGLYQTPEMVVTTAIQEEVDIIALSMLGGYPKGTCSEIIQLLREKGANDIVVVAGGLIPEDDKPALEEMGVTGNFGAGTSLETIVSHIRKRGWQRRLEHPVK